jgi:hypothetical protein
VTAIAVISWGKGYWLFTAGGGVYTNWRRTVPGIAGWQAPALTHSGPGRAPASCPTRPAAGRA